MSETVETWEAISPFNRLDRIRVPGGWIYRDLITSHDGKILSTAICFVPMPPPAPAR